MKFVSTVLVVFCSFVLTAQEVDIQKINAIVNAKIGDEDPGLMVGVVKDGNIVYEAYKGRASLEFPIKVDENTRSNIASMAKQFTALLILQLSLEEKLHLEDDIRSYLPKLYPAVREKIKIRHLLNHTSGIRDYADLMSIQRKPWWKRVGLDNEDVLALLEKQQDLGFAPGSRYLYSNSGYIVLAKIIERVTEESFTAYSKKFFEGLGMNNTGFSENYMKVIPNKATPYSDWGDGVWQEYPMLTNLNGDGFLYTTLKDQLVFEQAVQNAEGTNNVLLMKSQKAIPNSEITTYGFGLELENRLNYNAVHHSGNTGSYHAQVVRYPEENMSVFVMSSNSRIWSGTIADEIAATILPKKEATVHYDRSIENIKGETALAALVGPYVSPRGTIIRIQLNNGKLHWKMDNNNPIGLSREKGDLYHITGNAATKIGFATNSNEKGKLTVFYPDSETRLYRRIPAFQPTATDLEAYEGAYASQELEVGFTIHLNEQGKLILQMDGRKKAREIEIIHKDELLVLDDRMKVIRDVFQRVTGISLTTNRVLNNRFIKKTNLRFQPKIPTENGSIQVTTIGASDGQSSQILMTENDADGNEIWSNQFGGKSFDKASSIMATEEGYMIVGSTSSYGKGNYDMFVIKTDKKGNKIWQNAYGDFFNEYGYAAEKTPTGYLIKGTTQKCTSNTDVLNRKCSTNVWFVGLNEDGKELSREVLEEID